MKSKKWKLNSVEIKRIIMNGIIFLAPVAIAELTLAQQGVTEFRMYTVAFQVWAYGIAIDFFRKFKSGN